MENRLRLIRNILILILMLIISIITIKETFNYRNLTEHIEKVDNLSIASWNINIFGRKKSNTDYIINYLINTTKDYDIIILQEIRDKTNTTINKICSNLKSFYCIYSSRAGHTKSKEQYLVLMRKNKINIRTIIDLNKNLEYKKKFERPPLMINISTKKENYTLLMITIHTKPKSTKKEIEELMKLSKHITENLIIIGDLNADCNYYNFPNKLNYSLISIINKDTTTTKTDCAYDRIIINKNTSYEIKNYGIKETKAFFSDHKLIWVLLGNQRLKK